jgi:hypothetical protein
MALAAAAVVVVAVTMFARGGQVPVVPGASHQVAAVPAPAPVAKGAPAVAVAPAAINSRASDHVSKPVKELQVAVGLEGLSDVSLAQLSRELDGLDGLPSPEPENLGVSDPTAGGEGGL